MMGEKEEEENKLNIRNRNRNQQQQKKNKNNAPTTDIICGTDGRVHRTSTDAPEGFRSRMSRASVPITFFFKFE
jgi:hypothetical protein